MSKIRMDNFDSGDAARLVVKKFKGSRWETVTESIARSEHQMCKTFLQTDLGCLGFETKVDAPYVREAQNRLCIELVLV